TKGRPKTKAMTKRTLILFTRFILSGFLQSSQTCNPIEFGFGLVAHIRRHLSAIRIERKVRLHVSQNCDTVPQELFAGIDDLQTDLWFEELEHTHAQRKTFSGSSVLLGKSAKPRVKFLLSKSRQGVLIALLAAFPRNRFLSDPFLAHELPKQRIDEIVVQGS